MIEGRTDDVNKHKAKLCWGDAWMHIRQNITFHIIIRSCRVKVTAGIHTLFLFEWSREICAEFTTSSFLFEIPHSAKVDTHPIYIYNSVPYVQMKINKYTKTYTTPCGIHSGTFMLSEKWSHDWKPNKIKQNIFTIIIYEDYSSPYSYHMLQLITSF